MRLAAGMVAIQASIGALNDAQDAESDADRRASKPIPAGVVSVGQARGVALLAGLTGLALVAPSGPGAFAIALFGLGLGYAYDLRFSRTPVAWLPLAAALPLVPVLAWVGSVGSVPALILGAVPLAALAGAGLALGNALADAAVDRRSGVGSPVQAWGLARTWALHAMLLVGTWILAAAAWPVGEPEVIRRAALGVAAALLSVGAAGLTSARPSVLRVAWPSEAIGVALLGIGWLTGT